MSTAHNIIKYVAMALAIGIIVAIFSAIYQLGNILLFDRDEILLSEPKVYDYQEKTILGLDIDLSSSSLNIYEGDFRVETNTDDVKVEAHAGVISVEEKKKSWFRLNNDKKVVNIYIPLESSFDKVEIDGGAGSVRIDSLYTKELFLDLGAGNTTIDRLVVSDKFKLEAGVGSLIIKSGSINNLDGELGVGNTNISGMFTGKVDIESGVGNVKLDLKDSIDNYKIKATKGIGDFIINDKKIKNQKTVGNGDTLIKIEGGIGNITISTKQ